MNPVARDTRNDNQMFVVAPWRYGDLAAIVLSNFPDHRQIADAYEKESGELLAPSDLVRNRQRKSSAVQRTSAYRPQKI